MADVKEATVKEAKAAKAGRCAAGKCKEKVVAVRQEGGVVGSLTAYRCTVCGWTRVVRGSGKLYAPGTEPVWAASKEAEPKQS